MWKVGGWFFVILGAIGLALPLVPTVPFLILAAFCFERGSPELHRWLLAHPVFGPELRAWREHRVIRTRSKVIAIVCIASSVGYVMVFRDLPQALKILICVSCAGVIGYLLSQKSRPD